MKALALALLLILVFAILMLLAQDKAQNPVHPRHVQHPDGLMLAVNFAHADHVDQTCISCHHNYVDDTGIGMCFDCHKSDPEVAHLMEAQFHDLCRTCHIDQQLAGKAHGPTRACVACHVPDERP